MKRRKNETPSKLSIVTTIYVNHNLVVKVCLFAIEKKSERANQQEMKEKHIPN